MVDIFQSIISGDVNAVKAALDQGTNPNTIGQDGLYLIHYAAMSNQPQVYDLLISYQANVNATDFHNNNVLYYAARHGGSSEFFTKIINDGVLINNQNKIGQTACHIASRIGNVDALNGLLKAGANVNIKDIVGKTPLHDAIKTTHPEEILLLIEYGADINAKDKYNATPFSLGIASTNADINEIFNIPVLSKLKIPVENLLFEAVVTHDVVAAELALSKIPANATNEHGLTPLHLAALHGDVEMIKILLAHDASLIQTDFDGIQAIHFAAMSHQVQALDTLLSMGGAVNAVDKQGNTPLHYACKHADSIDIVQKIVDSGAFINTQNNQGETALHLAAQDGNLLVVKFLVEHQANTELKDNQGETAYQEAIKTHHPDVAHFLSKDVLSKLTMDSGIAPLKDTSLVLSDVVALSSDGIKGLEQGGALNDQSVHNPQPACVMVNSEAVIAVIVDTIL